MKHIVYELTDEFCKNVYRYENGDYLNYSFMEPPIIIYFVTTADEFGNNNVTPVSLGTYLGGEYFAFSLVHEDTGRNHDKENAWHTSPRDASYNLDQNGECVISYATKKQMIPIRITGCPVPTGIDEGELSGFTYYPSRFVSVPCINECPVNMEAKVVSSQVYGRIKLYVCKIKAVHVDEYYDKLDKESENLGLIITDPVFEVNLNDHLKPQKDVYDPDYNLRLKIASMGADTPLMSEHPKIGPRRRWLGTFEIWMEDELTIGTINREEYDRIIELYESWKKDRNPATNGDTKTELTNWLKEIIWERNLGA